MRSPIFPLLLLFVSVHATASSCGCCETSNGVLTTCADCPASTTGLHLGFCGLTSLAPAAFSSPALARVTAVDLSNNALRLLPAGAFDGLISLDLLNLSSNYISDVAPGALSSDHLPLLRTLDLGYNALVQLQQYVKDGSRILSADLDWEWDKIQRKLKQQMLRRRASSPRRCRPRGSDPPAAWRGAAAVA